MISFETAQIVPLRALNISVRSKQSSGFKDAKNNPCGHIVVWPSSCPPQGRLPASHPTRLSPRGAALRAAQQMVSTIARPSASFSLTLCPQGSIFPRGCLAAARPSRSSIEVPCFEAACLPCVSSCPAPIFLSVPTWCALFVPPCECVYP